MKSAICCGLIQVLDNCLYITIQLSHIKIYFKGKRMNCTLQIPTKNSRTLRHYALIAMMLPLSLSAGSYSWNLDEVDETGMYDLSFKYKPNAKTMAVKVWLKKDSKNEILIENLRLPATGSADWKRSSKIRRVLKAGSNYRIRVETIDDNALSSDAKSRIRSLRVDPAKPVQLIIDTDMLTDSDDGAALGVAHALEDKGEAKILGVMLSAHDEEHFNANTVSAINYYYNGSNSIKIGLYQDILDLDSNHQSISTTTKQNIRIASSDIHLPVWQQYTDNTRLKNYLRSTGDDIVSQYRRILAAADPKSIVIVVIGTNFNIKKIMTDSRTSSLFRAKVKEVIMSAWTDSCNMNMCAEASSLYPQASTPKAKAASDYVINHMPSDIKLTVNDNQVNIDNIPGFQAGQDYATHNADSPMRILYEAHCRDALCETNSLDKGNNIVDQMAVLYAVRGLGYEGNQYFRTYNNSIGYIEAKFGNNNRAYWHTGTSKNHNKLKITSTTTGSSYITMLRNQINSLMMRAPSAPRDYTPDGTYVDYLAVPNAPRNLRVTDISTDSARLRWEDKTSIETNYFVYRGDRWVATLPANSTSYEINNLTADTVYTYRIKAVNQQGADKAKSDALEVDFRTKALPSKPTNVQSSVTKDSISLTWTDSANEDGYKIYVNGTLVKTLPAGTTRFKIEDLESNTNYTVEIKSYNAYASSALVKIEVKTKKKSDDIPITYLILN